MARLSTTDGDSKMRIENVIDALERAPRQGTPSESEKDGRFVVFSEAAVDLLIKELRLAATERPEGETFALSHGGYQPRCGVGRGDPPRGGSGVPSGV